MMLTHESSIAHSQEPRCSPAVKSRGSPYRFTRVENDVWLCSPHVTEHIHSPDVGKVRCDFD
jgi:hypothetical protein